MNIACNVITRMLCVNFNQKRSLEGEGDETGERKMCVKQCSENVKYDVRERNVK